MTATLCDTTTGWGLVLDTFNTPSLEHLPALPTTTVTRRRQRLTVQGGRSTARRRHTRRYVEEA